MPFSTYLGNEILDHVFGNGSYTVPDIYVALFIGDPAGAGSEVSGGSYARVAHSAWDSASGKATENTGTITFPTSTATWGGTIDYFALYDASTAGNMLGSGALDTNRSVTAAGITLSFADGALDVTFDA